MIKISKIICFKIIGSHHTLNIIVVCKTIVTTEPTYRTYCEGYPLSPYFKVFSLSISISEVGTKGTEEGIRLNILLDVFYIFYIIFLKAFLK